MKKLWGLLAVSVFCGALGVGGARADEPNKIKVGVLLPLTGTFAAVAETQKQGALLAIDVVNKRGGLNMPWGKVTVEGAVDDDEAKLDVGVRRYRYLVSEGIRGVGGQTWAPLAYAINAIVSKEPMPYFPVCVMAKEGFQKGKLADSTFATAYSPWTVGYMAGTSAIKTLGKKRKSSSWPAPTAWLGHSRTESMRRRSDTAGRSWAMTKCRWEQTTSPPSCKRFVQRSPTCSFSRNSAPTLSRCSSRPIKWAWARR